MNPSNARIDPARYAGPKYIISELYFLFCLDTVAALNALKSFLRNEID